MRNAGHENIFWSFKTLLERQKKFEDKERSLLGLGKKILSFEVVEKL
jgi:hypothetical protein